LSKTVWRWLGVIFLAAALGGIGYGLLFTQFMIYDDEGYVLWSLRSYDAVGGLYERVFSQYGPFFYTFYHGLHLLTGLTFTNETGRLLTLGYWVATALLCGGFVRRQTKDTSAAFAAAALTFASLYLMTSEPIHPGGLLTVLTALATCGAAAAIRGNEDKHFSWIVGLSGAAMALTKLNVGVFFLVPAGAWLLIGARQTTWARPAAWLSAIGCVAVPLILMRPHWPSLWVTNYALIFSCGSLAVLAACFRMRNAKYGWGSLALAVGSALGLSVLIVIATCSRGTSLAMLAEGAFIAPFRHPGIYSFQGRWQPGARELAVAGALLTLAYHFRKDARWTSPILALLRIGLGLWYFSRAASAEQGWLHRFGFDYGPSLAALFIIPLERGSATAIGRARTWVAWVFVWQTLQGYPVAGTQTSWGSFLWAPLCVCGWQEAVEYSALYFDRRRRAIKAASYLILMATGLTALVPLARLSYWRFVLGEPLGLTGAAHLRLREDLASTLRIFDQNIRAHAGLLFSDPGMFSFNIWTERPTPTDANVTHWFSLLSEPQQQAIVARLEADSRAAIVVNRYLFSYLVDSGFPPRGTLQLYIAQHFAPALRVDTYELWVHRGRHLAPLSLAQIAPIAPGRVQLELVVDALKRPVATAELRMLFPPYTRLYTLPADTAHPWQSSPLTLSNEPAGPTSAASAPIMIAQPTRLTMEFALPHELPPLDQIEIKLLDQQGAVLASLRFPR
jgi:hypothetical protein